jgi:uncharacterized protein YlxW (UPF0749 family)
MSPCVALVAVLVTSALGAFWAERPQPAKEPIELGYIPLIHESPAAHPLPLAGPALHGPGLVITLRDSKRKPGPDEDAYFFLVHDADLSCLLQELSGYGAEGLSLNDRRVVFPGTELRSVGPNIVLNGESLVQPYVVKAIGPKALRAGLSGPNCWADSMAMFQRSEGMIQIEEVKDLTVPPLSSSGYRYATPIP